MQSYTICDNAANEQVLWTSHWLVCPSLKLIEEPECEQ